MSVWAMKVGDRLAKEFSASDAGLAEAVAYVSPAGIVEVFPGSDSLVIPTITDEVVLIHHKATATITYTRQNNPINFYDLIPDVTKYVRPITIRRRHSTDPVSLEWFVEAAAGDTPQWEFWSLHRPDAGGPVFRSALFLTFLGQMILNPRDDSAMPVIQKKSVPAPIAPGAGYGSLRWETGTNPGTLKLVAYSGTSTTGVTVVDNVGAGN